MKTVFFGNVARGLLLIVLLLLNAQILSAQTLEDDFVLRDIRVEGLQRISEGTVFNYLPLNIGDVVSNSKIREALRVIYSTEFFKDVEFRRDNDTLIIAVLERPSISNFEITGNKDIKTEDLVESLSEIGLKKGRILNRSVLEDVERSLTEEYFAQGKYSASIAAEIEDLEDNKVNITIKIKEGERSRIRQINIVGNQVYDDDVLLEELTLKTPNWLSWFRQDDRYSREALQGDLEKIKSIYMDRGYADFGIDSTQVAISPNKEDIFITVNIVEGDLYKISDVKLAGDFILPESELTPYVLAKPGQIFSQQLLTSTEELIQLRLGEEGYAFTDVEPVVELDEENLEVEVTFYVDPKSRVYVRRINFNGADSVNDEVFRREMRQLEGAYLSKNNVDRSKIRLQRLPYIDEVGVETIPVPGTPDLVDIDFEITEGLPGQFGGGIGYSDAQGALFNLNFVHTNFLGTGNRVQANVNTGRFRTIYNGSYTNPYVGLNEVSQTINFGYANATQFTSEASDLETETLSGGMIWGYPLTEYQRVNIGFNIQRAELIASQGGSSQQSLNWVLDNGSSSLNCVPFPSCPLGSTGIVSSEFDSIELLAGWSFDTRNRSLFANRGARHVVSLSATLPGSDVEYFTARYTGTQYLPFTRYFTLALNLDLGYAQALGDTTSIPPYKNYFGGGPDSIRGYQEDSLGPQDSRFNPYGGNLLVAGQAEIILPIPEKWRSRSRFVLFYDIGNVFSTEGTIDWFDVNGNQLSNDFYDFDTDFLKQSFGIAAEWLAPLGLFQFSYGVPVNEFKGSNNILADETETFQFTIGGAF
ncbi:MAG: outer membrane protein assembly factor BamA [Pseudomonadota bacterium]|nr:outer membrane protein assembly factor BamA [Pseudomonadota bacterium]